MALTIDGTAASRAARARLLETEGAPLFLADWSRMLLLHFEVDPEPLQRATPFELDLHLGRAYVSLVAFVQERLRPRLGGRFTERLSRPVASHAFLNVRTYVRAGGEPGIFFIAEWIPNALAKLLGPLLYGLPYELGQLEYAHEHERGALAGEVRPRGMAGGLKYRAKLDRRVPFETAPGGSRTAWLMERYTAYTERNGRKRRFRIWHPPWPQAIVKADLEDLSLLESLGAWAREPRYAGATYSPGVENVWIGRPQALKSARQGEQLDSHAAAMREERGEGHPSRAYCRAPQVRSACARGGAGPEPASS
ncbi:MAG: DUF2071 domain-containing protein [Planctomycetota bacterium]|nr:DUF2071 domain-containing protein [Planctomycetota bacterium]